MNCHDCQQHLVDYLTGQAEASVARQVENHLDSGCQDCRELLESLSAAHAAMLTSAPEHRPSAATIESIEQEIHHAIDDGHFAPARHAKGSGAGSENLDVLKRWMIPALATAAGFAMAIVMIPRSDDHLELGSASTHGQTDPLPPRFQSMSDPNQRLVSVVNRREPTQPLASFWIDRVANQLHVHAVNWDPLDGDAFYAIWLVDPSGHWTFAGQVGGDDDRDRTRVLDIPNMHTTIQRIAVTIERGPQSPRDGRSLDDADLVSEDLTDWFENQL
ncbi:anti-sigma factor domain-containing protein [Crateriforma conspicua]|uniref:Anti-sigma-K factor rskA n=1 Tax=Crateriforma conspicua TaxID=2527996 RepID=A0A5C6FXZ7_9PLAN|nr:anti-sigma factor [Crateriforma conspicua]TWU66200.1 Anti-sigma-K factor rskA [Crateriforma conspicua]